jgi:hypothetical protein
VAIQTRSSGEGNSLLSCYTGPRWTAGVQFPTGGKGFGLLHNFQSGSGAHSAYPLGTVSCFLGDKVTGVRNWQLTYKNGAGVRPVLHSSSCS